VAQCCDVKFRISYSDVYQLTRRDRVCRDGHL
jgi:hypothetical protein